LGLSKDEILSRFGEIEAFAEIGVAIDRPVKTYSSGMMMRLAFAVQVLCDPDILIIDEALSVGDFFFQQKCLSYIRGLSAKGVTLIFDSHDMGAVRDLCSRVVYLLSGEQKFEGDTAKGVSLYFRGAERKKEITRRHESENDSISNNTNQAPQSLSDQLVDPIWELDTETPVNCKARILEVGMYDRHGKPVTNFQIGQSIQLRLRYQIFCDVPVHIGFFIKNKYDQVVNATTSYTLSLNPPELKWGESSYFGADIVCNLEAGEYSIACTLGVEIAMVNQGESLFETPPLGPFRITWDYSDKVAPFFGMVGLPVNAFFGPIDQNGSA
jgi:lipopolysaccharide transport system ATP-binding protein